MKRQFHYLAIVIIGLITCCNPILMAGDQPVSKNQKDITIKLGGTMRLRYENWDEGDIVPNSRAAVVPPTTRGSTAAWRKGYDDDYILTNLKLHVAVDFSETLRAFVEMEYATIEDAERLDGHRRYTAKPHIQQGYLQRDDSVNRLTLGRQVLEYGSRMVIGENNWVNNTISYDLVRYDHFADTITASVFGGYEVFEPHNQDTDHDNLVGGYHLAFQPRGWRVEQYTFYKNYDQRNGAADFDAFSIGGRVKNSWEKIDMDLDAIQQAGDQKGFATHGYLVRHINPGHWANVNVYTAVNVASGGKGWEDNYIAFNPAGHLDRQSTDFAPYINLKEYGFGIAANPLKDQPLLVRLSWFDMYMFDKSGAIYSGGPDNVIWGSSNQRPQKIEDSRLGHHVNLFASYKLDKTNTAFSTCLTRYFVEDAIHTFPNRRNTTFFYFSVAQSF